MLAIGAWENQKDCLSYTEPRLGSDFQAYYVSFPVFQKTRDVEFDMNV